jgi:alcohol dehydrogenase class IV
MRLSDFPQESRIVEMSYPTKVVFGIGALNRLPAQVERLKVKKALLVTDGGVVKSGLAERAIVVLRAAGIPFAVFDSVRPDPTEQDAFEGVAAYRKLGCDGLIAIGGGSPLDTAKLIDLLVTHEPPLSRYDDAAGGDRFIRDDLPPLIAIPTTAGTGSEVSRSGVATLSDTGRKTVIFSPYLLPKAAICDPELTVGLPAALTAATGMDAFTHCLEAYLANAFHPLADALAIDGIGRVAQSLEKAVRDGANLAARSQMMVAAMEGAMAFQKGLGACHALAHALTPISRLHHGLANAIVLPAVLEFNRGACVARLAQVAITMGDNSLAREEVLASNAIERIRKMESQIGIPTRLRDAGVREVDLPLIASKAFQDASHLTNPRRCSEEDLLSLARSSF